MARTQRYGIKFPVTVLSDEKTLFDLNLTSAENINSQLMHLVFTPKGQKLRDPNFGTNLIQYIFNPNDKQTWDDVVDEIKTAVKAYVPGCLMRNIDIATSDDGLELYARMQYSVDVSGDVENYEVLTKL